MKRILLGVAAGLLLLGSQGPAYGAAAKSGCVDCHTNGEMLKSLHKPPAMEGGEAEG